VPQYGLPGADVHDSKESPPFVERVKCPLQMLKEMFQEA